LLTATARKSSRKNYEYKLCLCAQFRFKIIMVHEVRLRKNASCKTLKDYGIILDRNPHLKIKSLLGGQQFRTSETVDENTDLSEGYTIVGVNNTSCRGLTPKQLETLIKMQDGDEVILLVRGSKVELSAKGMPDDDCLCGKGCDMHALQCECLCTIQ